MSYRVSDAVWSHSAARGAAKLVLLALASFCDEYGRCWPSLTTLVAKTGHDRRTVQRSLRQLQVLGELVVASGGGRGGVSHYTLIVRDQPDRLAAVETVTDLPEKAAERRRLGSRKGGADVDKGRRERPERAANLPEKAAERRPEPVKNRSLNGTGQRTGQYLLPNPPPQAEEGTRQRRRRRGNVDAQDDAATTATQPAPAVAVTPKDRRLFAQVLTALRTDGWTPGNIAKVAELVPIGRTASGGMLLAAPPGRAGMARFKQHIAAALVDAGDPAGADVTIVEP